MNVELVMVEGRKMSRSLNNALSLSGLQKDGYSGSDIRLFLLSIHYRKPVNYSAGLYRRPRIPSEKFIRLFDGFMRSMTVSAGTVLQKPIS